MEIKPFLDTHTREVLVFILEQYVASYQVRGAIKEAGLAKYTKFQKLAPLDSPWPTLEELITHVGVGVELIGGTQ